LYLDKSLVIFLKTMTARTADEDCYEITWLIRRLFRAMAARAEDHVQAEGISVADRAVLEFLSGGEALAVPTIAARYDVSRQHVQVTVNRLRDKGFVRTRPNPQHKRSPLIELTQDGAKVFARIHRRDVAVIADLFDGIPVSNCQVTRRTLARLYERLNEGAQP
jgi:DNA-binding MarR family transcriptional regulator